MKLLAFGEVLWDVFPDAEHLGGAPMNFAAHFQKCGGKAWMLTAVGNDALGKRTIAEIENTGIGTEWITVSEKQTGQCLVTLDESAVPSYHLLDDVAYDDIQKPGKETDFDILYFGTLALRHEQNRNTLTEVLSDGSFTDVFVDMNIRAPFYSDEVIRFACQHATMIKISDEEMPVVTEALGQGTLSERDCALYLCEAFKNLRVILITKGEKGSLVLDCTDKRFYESGAAKAEVVSTVGAGDSFSAAFLAKYKKTKDMNAALALASKISGYVVSQEGAIPPYTLSDFE